MTPLFKTFQSEIFQQNPALFIEADEFEQIGICLCLIPILQPDLLDQIAKIDLQLPEGDAPQLGGLRGSQHRGIIPTGQTWAFFACENALNLKAEFIEQLPDYLNNPKALLSIEGSPLGEPFLAGKLVFSAYFKSLHRQSALFYEQRLSDIGLGGFIKTGLKISDLVLSEEVNQAIDEIKYWQYFNESERKIEFNKRLKPGLKVLFHGKPGTGKTQVAGILGNQLKKAVYRIDLSQIVSKYIGETEKNLAKVFDLAQSRNWILFFDEADALFGKRTAVNSSHDRYANQEVAYLLQKIEDYNGIIIIASNFKENIDTAFMRRFQIIAEFALPNANQRETIWRKLIAELSGIKINLSDADYLLVASTELSGGSITNAINFALQKALYRKIAIDFGLLKEGIIKELRKENRLISL
jgi:AAA+ superfamily predicted ATPase